jgi:hypothetical protein
MTRKSVSLEIGAIAKRDVEKCLERFLSRPLADTLGRELTGRRTKTEKDCMEGKALNKGPRRGRGVEGEYLCSKGLATNDKTPMRPLYVWWVVLTDPVRRGATADAD